MYVCVCLAVSERQLEQAIEDGAHSLTDLRRIFGMTLECGRCTETARRFLQRAETPSGAVASEPLRTGRDGPAPSGATAPEAAGEGAADFRAS